MSTKYIDIVFDGPPDMPAPRFVEIENDQGASIRLGTWIPRENGLWVIRITPDSLEEAIGK